MTDVTLQAGHCFRTAGSTGTRAAGGRPTEQEVAWDVSQRAARILTSHGHTPSVIVADPASRSAYRGDCFVAVHCDGSSSASARGASVGYRTGEGQSLAHAWKQAYAKRGWRGFRADNYTAALQGYYGTRRAIEQGNRMACIIEAGFLTNPSDAGQLSTAAGRERVALAISDAVNSHHPPTVAPQEDEIVFTVAEAGAYVDEAYRLIVGRPPTDYEKYIWAHAIAADAREMWKMQQRLVGEAIRAAR